MEAEFINEYIARLLSNLSDVTNKAIMLETRLALADKVIASLQVELREKEIQVEKLQSKKTKTESSPI